MIIESLILTIISIISIIYNIKNSNDLNKIQVEYIPERNFVKLFLAILENCHIAEGVLSITGFDISLSKYL